MADKSRTILQAAVQKLLRPLVRLLLRNGFSYGDFASLAKWVFVDVASEEFGIQGRKQTVSRVSVITGLNRKEVARVQKLEVPDDAATGHQYNRAARVIAGWLGDKRFQDTAGQPRPLSFDADEVNFMQLAKAQSGDIPPRAILDELLRVGAVKRLRDGRIRLLTKGYVPAAGEKSKLHILGTDVALLLATIDHNLQFAESDPRFQRKVAYDNLPEEAIPGFRQLSADKAQELLLELNEYLARHDRDANPQARGSGRKQAGMGIYYFEQDFPEE